MKFILKNRDESIIDETNSNSQLLVQKNSKSKEKNSKSQEKEQKNSKRKKKFSQFVPVLKGIFRFSPMG